MMTWTSLSKTVLLLIAALVVIAALIWSAQPVAAHTPTTICHKPGTAAEHTIVVDQNSVLQAHLRHGDTLGPCTATPTDTPTESVPSSEPTPTDTPTESPSDVPSDTPTITPTPEEPSGSIDVPLTNPPPTPCWEGCHESTPPHEHITNPPTDTVGTATDQEVDSQSLLLAIAGTLLITALLTTRIRNRESN